MNNRKGQEGSVSGRAERYDETQHINQASPGLASAGPRLCFVTGLALKSSK